MSSSRSIAAARNRRASDGLQSGMGNKPPITSIQGNRAFIPQNHQNPQHPQRTNPVQRMPQNQPQYQQPQQQQQHYKQQQQQQQQPQPQQQQQQQQRRCEGP